MKRFVSAFVVILATLTGGCGGGGGGGDGFVLGPFWVETDVVSADLNADGRPDVVTIASLQRGGGDAEGSIRVYRQVTQGNFMADEYVVGRYPWRVAAHDIDGDGRLDLVVLDVGNASLPNDHTLYLLLQDRLNPGRFQAPTAIASGLSALDFAITDLNRDGVPDIVAGSSAASDGAQLLVQNATQRGTFQPPTALALPGRAAAVAAGDINGDGIADLAFYGTTGFSTSTGSSGQIVIVYALAGGGFGTPVALAPQVGLNAELVRIADADGNGLADVFVLFNPFSTDYRPKLTVLLQTSTGNFSAADTSLATVRGTDGFAVADLNGDSRPDVAATGFYPVGSPSQVRSDTSILLHASGGSYQSPATYAMVVSMNQITAADIDGDGFNDLVLLGGDNQAFVMYQVRGAPGTFAAARGL